MQIDLYRSLMHTMADAQYIGSIVVENIKPRHKGDPSIELIISSNEQGELTADAADLDSSAEAGHLHLAVSLKSLDISSHEYDIPDFELEPSEPPPQGLYEKASRLRKRPERKKIPWILIIIIGLAIVLAVLAFWFFLLRGGSTPAKPASGPIAEQPARAPEPAPAAETAQSAPESAQVPVITPEPEPPVPESAPAQVPVIAAQPEPAKPEPAAREERRSEPVIPKGGAVYRIRWGDTLWDISEAFYRNPWLYPRIARYNGIRNPDLIISGTTIRIPPKN
jgi:Na+-transporting methylmalonyl-CoA/oxaloacetate decarboxylase gamma subunit